VLLYPVFSLRSNANSSIITSLIVRNLESRKESIERRKIRKVAQALDYFIDGDQGNHNAQDWHLPEHISSLANGQIDPSRASTQGVYDIQANPPGGGLLAASRTAEEAQDADLTRDKNIVVSKPGISADDGTLDLKDKRDRDLVYARASYLIRESLSMQGWSAQVLQVSS
jgi:hypothetical protein